MPLDNNNITTRVRDIPFKIHGFNVNSIFGLNTFLLKIQCVSVKSISDQCNDTCIGNYGKSS